MPDSEVSVKVTYKNAPVTTYSLTTQVNGGHGTISESKTGLTEGSTETVIFTPDNGYEIELCSKHLYRNLAGGDDKWPMWIFGNLAY